MCNLYPLTSNCESEKAWFITKYGTNSTSKTVRKLCRKKTNKLFCDIYSKTIGKTFFNEKPNFGKNIFDKNVIGKINKKLQRGKLGSNAMYPASDTDGDGFGSAATVRGWHWNGFDCNDKRNDINANNTGVDGETTTTKVHIFLRPFT